MVTFVDDDTVSNIYRTDGNPGVLVTAVVAQFIRDDRGRIDAWRHFQPFNFSTGQFASMGDVETKKKFDVFATDGSPLPEKWFSMPKETVAYFCKGTDSR
ncbi:MAG: hypothetical protein ABIP88_03155 [Candidatus Binatia bacterium]